MKLGPASGEGLDYPQLAGEHVQANRLGDIVIRFEVVASLLVPRSIGTGQHDDGYRAQFRVNAQRRQHRVPTHPRQLEIENDDFRAWSGLVWDLAVQERHGLLPVGHNREGVADARPVQRLAEETDISRVVLDQQDLYRLCCPRLALLILLRPEEG